jgi:hypothetical protein
MIIALKKSQKEMRYVSVPKENFFGGGLIFIMRMDVLPGQFTILTAILTRGQNL